MHWFLTEQVEEVAATQSLLNIVRRAGSDLFDIEQYVARELGSVTRATNGAAKSWRFAKATTAGPVVFSSGANALSVAQAAGLTNVSLLAADDGLGKGTSKYGIDLSK